MLLNTVKTIKNTNTYYNTNAEFICFVCFKVFPETSNVMACLGHPISSTSSLKNSKKRKNSKTNKENLSILMPSGFVYCFQAFENNKNNEKKQNNYNTNAKFICLRVLRSLRFFLRHLV